MENQFKSSSQATIGQLFDKAVDKVMNDQNFRKAMETSGSSYSWSCGQQQVGFSILKELRLTKCFCPSLHNETLYAPLG